MNIYKLVAPLRSGGKWFRRFVLTAIPTALTKRLLLLKKSLYLYWLIVIFDFLRKSNSKSFPRLENDLLSTNYNPMNIFKIEKDLLSLFASQHCFLPFTLQ